MTRETAKQLLPIITAFADGKTIQRKYGQDTEWMETLCPEFDNPNFQFRIKPEPREFWVIRGENGGLQVSPSLPTPIAEWHGQIIKVREVIE